MRNVYCVVCMLDIQFSFSAALDTVFFLLSFHLRRLFVRKDDHSTGTDTRKLRTNCPTDQTHWTIEQHSVSGGQLNTDWSLWSDVFKAVFSPRALDLVSLHNSAVQIVWLSDKDGRVCVVGCSRGLVSAGAANRRQGASFHWAEGNSVIFTPLL